MNTRSKFKY